MIGPQFLTLCDVLMHRAIFFSKAYYEKRVESGDIAAFREMCMADHTGDGAMETLAEMWCNHVAFRKANKMQMAYGIRTGAVRDSSLQGTPSVSARARILEIKGAEEDGDAAGGGGGRASVGGGGEAAAAATAADAADPAAAAAPVAAAVATRAEAAEATAAVQTPAAPPPPPQ